LVTALHSLAKQLRALLCQSAVQTISKFITQFLEILTYMVQLER